jgi:hypothetical protein
MEVLLRWEAASIWLRVLINKSNYHQMNSPKQHRLPGVKHAFPPFLKALFMLGLCMGATDALAQSAATPPGDGTLSSPYQISQIEHLAWVSDNVGSSSGQYYQLLNDIDASAYGGEGFKPIGSYVDASNQQPFSGIFDGNGHNIQNVVISRPGEKFVGPFGFIGLQGQIRNLRLEGVSITGGGRVGGLVGQSYGMVTNCHVSGFVSGGMDRVGGLVGQNWANGVIWDCSSSCTVSGISNVVGGLVGLSHGIIVNSGATGPVTGNNVVGGLVGTDDAGITNCFASGSVTSQGSQGSAGGLVGLYTGTNGISGASNYGISGSHADGTVQGQGPFIGGLLGINTGFITNCYATGAALGQGYCVGGLVGFNISSIAGCQAGGDVSGTGDETDGSLVGGLVGQNFTSGTIVNCSATGNVIGQYHFVGGLVGGNLGAIADCQAGGGVTGNGNTTAGSRSGGLVGDNESEASITNCKATGSVLGLGPYAGALVGANYGQISGCRAEGDVSATGNDTYATCVGGLVGYSVAGGSILDSTATGNVNGQFDNVGGLVGNNLGTIAHCQASGSVTTIGSPTRGSRVGGLAGASKGSITDCRATGTVQGDGPYVGGLVGLNYNVVSGCHAGGDVSGVGNDSYGACVGGLVGNNSIGGSVVNSSAWGNVTGQFDNVGGLAGWNRAEISMCQAGGRVTGNGTASGGACAGGLVGFNTGSIADSFATGTVQGLGASVGGLAGNNQSAITRCYSAGPVSGPNLAGGLVGENSSGSVETSYWDAQTSGQSYSAGSDASFGKTTAQMRQQATFEGWDFVNVWGISENQAYPSLKAMPDFLPEIALQPQTQAIVLGDAITFHVEAASIAALSYQWQWNETNIPNATNSTYSIASALQKDAGSYRVIVTSSAGAMTSSNAVLTVYTTAAGSLQFSGAPATGCQLNITGVPGYSYVIQTSTNLVTWDCLQTNKAPFRFTGTDIRTGPMRFYRAIYLP